MIYNLILPEKPSTILQDMIDVTLKDIKYNTIKNKNDLVSLKSKKIVFAIELPITGQSSNLNDIFLNLFKDKESLENSEAIILIHSSSILNTRSCCQSIIFNSNLLGCRFVGRPIVEATKDLSNVLPLQKIYKKDLKCILLDQCKDLSKRFINYNKENIKEPTLLVVHSANKNKSNTYALWNKVKNNISNIDIDEINLWNKSIKDCIGCSYSICKSKGMNESCIYDDIITKELYPKIIEADGLLLISPNYNDMLEANIIATINRLTAIFRKHKFYNKKVFSIIVSGHSGIEALAKQIISSININKTFQLPPYFSLYAQASEPGSINKVKDIEKLAESFAKNIEKEIRNI